MSSREVVIRIGAHRFRCELCKAQLDDKVRDSRESDTLDRGKLLGSRATRSSSTKTRSSRVEQVERAVLFFPRYEPRDPDSEYTRDGRVHARSHGVDHACTWRSEQRTRYSEEETRA
jgi:hypothetical protein